MRQSRPKAKPKTVYGLSPKNYPRNLRWQVDQDYLDKLSPEELTFMAAFNERYYGADFRGEIEEEWPPELRRKSYRAKNAANRGDVYGVAQAVGNLKFAGDKPLNPRDDTNPVDFKTVPQYLNSPDYKAALKNYRVALSNKKTDPLVLASLRRKLEMYTHEVPQGNSPKPHED